MNHLLVALSYIYVPIKTLLQRQIDNFIDTYGQDSNSLFKDKEGRLIHPLLHIKKDGMG